MFKVKKLEIRKSKQSLKLTHVIKKGEQLDSKFKLRFQMTGIWSGVWILILTEASRDLITEFSKGHNSTVTLGPLHVSFIFSTHHLACTMGTTVRQSYL